MREYYPLLVIGAILGLFSAVFTAAYLTIRKQKEAIGFDRNMKDGEIIRRLMKYAKPHWRKFLLVGILMLASIAYDIVSPLVVGHIEEMFSSPFEVAVLFRWVAFYAGVLVVSLACSYAQAILLQITGQKILSAIREDLFVHIESLSHAQLNAIPVGKLVTRVTNDTGAISMMFTNIFVNLMKNTFVITGVFIAMLCLNYELTLMILCFVPFIVLFTVIFRKFSRKAYRRVKDGTTDINTFLSEHLSGMKIIQIFNREAEKKAQFDEKNRFLGRAKRAQILTFAVFRPVVYMLYVASVLCLLYLGGRGYIKETSFLGQTITSGVLVSFYMYISKFFNPIQSLAEQFNWLQSAMASAEKIFTVFDMEPEIVDEPDAVDLDRVDGDIEFRHVWFAYEGEEWVLRDVSFKVNARETAAFVGATGSGKTTILALICRNYDIQRGEILIDGIDVRHIRIASLRRHFGQMLQDVFLFAGTVRSNLVLREDGISDREVEEACRYVNADKFISRLPRGLDEEVRERGNNFSTGQRQLLSFARTILHKPSVMILDEATANIDTETEILIQNSLEKMKNIGTMLIVAHRLSTIRSADRIFVISRGEIVEEGTHDELLRLGGFYYKLYRIQEKKQELKA
ncbi:MAG: ABC transporter ATP-binding protein/permease [Clostridiales bacterium]|nr:ABC transporter ATP-binding protein/permease [Clostridiales bacterium]